MKKYLRLTPLVLAFFACSGHAQVADFLQQITPPKVLAPVGQAKPILETYYLKYPSRFGYDVIPAEQGRLKLPPDIAKPKIWVDFKSQTITAGLVEQLKSRQINIANSADEADFVLRGEVSYYSENHPFRGTRLVLDQRFDSKELLEDSSKAVTLPRAAYNLAPAYAYRGADPITFGVGVFNAILDVTGASQAIEKMNATEEKKKEEVFKTLDCYDKDTRASTCSSVGLQVESYRHKFRLQAVSIKAEIKARDQAPFQRTQIIARRIEDRTATEVALPALLSTALNDLISDFGQYKPRD